MATSAHVSKVRSLYKRILLLHRFLPIDLKALGDQYVKEEFRRHKGVSLREGTAFMAEWEVRCFAYNVEKYAVMFYLYCTTTHSCPSVCRLELTVTTNSPGV